MKDFQLPIFSISPDSNARFRVDLPHGYISYGAQDVEKAIEVFISEGLRLRICRDIFDDGRVVAGLPEEVDDVDA